MPSFSKPFFIFSSLFLLSSCSTQQAPSSSVQACIDKLPNSKLIKKQAITTGCFITAGLWKAIGQDNPASLVCMAGGGAGFLIGSSIAERKCSYRVAEEQIDGEIAHAQKVNLGFNFIFMQQAENLLKQQAIVSSLLAQHKAEKANLIYTATVKKDLTEMIENEKKLLKTLLKEVVFKRETLSMSKRQTNKNKSISLNNEIKLLNKNIQSLRKENLKLYQLENKLAGI